MNYSKQKLEKLADEVVSLSRGEDSLVSSILRVLKSNPMNPEQVRRLVEMTNTNKFLDKFKDTYGDDRFVDFDVLDPEDIIQKFLGKDAIVDSKSKGLSLTIKSTPEGTLVTRREMNDPGIDTEESRFFDTIESTKEKSAEFNKVAKDMSFSKKYDKNPHLKGKQKNLPDEIQEKIVSSKHTSHKEKMLEDKPLTKKESSRAKGMSFSKKYDKNPHLKGKQKNLPDEIQEKIVSSKLSPHNEKMLEDKLLTKKESSSYACDHIAEVLSQKFKGIYSRQKHSSFEMEALANYGLDSLPALQAVRIKLGKDLLNASSITNQQVKQASQYYLSDINSLGMKEVGQYLDKVGEYVDACLDLAAFYKGTNKTASLDTVSNFLGNFGGVTGQVQDTAGYRLNKRVHHWADRIKARDRSLEQAREKVVGFALDGIVNKIEDSFDEREKNQTRQDQKIRRLEAAKTMFKQNPDLRAAGKSNALMAINMVGKVAPELSTSVPFLTAHVKQMVYNSDGGIPVIDAQSIKSMSEAERAFENLGRFKQA